MASQKTNGSVPGSLSLMPMNSANYRARTDGVTNADTDRETSSYSARAAANGLRSGFQDISEEDMVPPLDPNNGEPVFGDRGRSMASNGESDQGSNMNSLDLKPQKRTILANNNQMDDLNEAEMIVDGPANKVMEEEINLEKKYSQNDHRETDHSASASAVDNEPRRLSYNQDSNIINRAVDDVANEETRQLSKSSSKLSSDSKINDSQPAKTSQPFTEQHPQNQQTQEPPKEAAPQQGQNMIPNISNLTVNENNVPLSEQQKLFQRQFYEQQLEKKKMEHFNKITGRGEYSQTISAKSVSPMSPKTTTLHQKINNLEQAGPQMGSVIQKHGTVSHAPSSNLHAPNTRSSRSHQIMNNYFNESDSHKKQQNGPNVTKPQNEMDCFGNILQTNQKRNQSPFRDPSNLYLKQINDQQRPLYTPAVLRVVKNNPTSGNLETGFDVHKLPNDKPGLSRNSSSISVRSTASSIVDYWHYLTGNAYKKVVEEGPTRKHWKPDSSRFNCVQCGKLFNYLTEHRRKHHCRSCGEIYCGECLKNYIYLDENAEFTLFGSNWDDDDTAVGDDSNNFNDEDTYEQDNLRTKRKSISLTAKKSDNDKKYLCKVCLKCFKQYEEFVLDHTTRDHNLGDNDNENKKKKERRNTIVDGKNIPVDWNWSSF